MGLFSKKTPTSTHPHRFLFLNILFIACLAGIATDIYAPSLSAIAFSMHAPISKVQLSLSIFMVGLAISQLVYGPLSEGVGRRYPLIIGLIIFVCASTFCAISTSINMLILGRFLQGLGAGASSSLWRSVFRDIYQGDELAKYGSYLSIIIVFMLPAVPILGGYLQHFIGWQAAFYVLIVFGTGTLFLLLSTFNETSKHHHKDRLKRPFIIQSFRQLLTSRIFMGYALCVFFSYGAFFSWITIGPVLLIKTIGLTPVEFGWVSFGMSSIAMASASALNGRLVVHFGSQCMLRFGWISMCISGLLLFLGQSLLGVNLYGVLLPVFMFYFGVTFIWPNAFSGAFTPFGHIAGYAGALYGFLQLAGAAIIGSFAAHLSSDSAHPIGMIFILSPLLAWTVYEIIVNQKPKSSQNKDSRI